MPARSGPAPRGSRVSDPWPPREDFHALAGQGNLIPVSREILADLETPVSAFLKIHRGAVRLPPRERAGRRAVGALQLPRHRAGARAARSAATTVEVETPRTASTERRTTDDPLERAAARCSAAYRAGARRRAAALLGGAVGYLGYDVVRAFERLPARAADDLGLPDVCMMLVREPARLRQRRRRRSRSSSHARPRRRDAAGRAPTTRRSRASTRWSRACGAGRCAAEAPRGDEPRRAAVQHDAGRVPGGSSSARRSTSAPATSSRSCCRSASSCRCAAAPFDVYRACAPSTRRRTCSTCALGAQALAGASPEVMVRVEDGEVTVRPIAGTRPRGTQRARGRARSSAELLRRSEGARRARHARSTSAATTSAASPRSARSR